MKVCQNTQDFLNIFLLLIVPIALVSSPDGESKPRVLISDSNSWAASGGFSTSGGSLPKADFVIIFDRESSKRYAMKRDQIAVFKKDRDVLFFGSTQSVGNAVKCACDAIENALAVK